MIVNGKLCLVLLACLVFVAVAYAQGTNSWATGYPKEGATKGSIVVKGTLVPDAGYIITGAGRAVIWKTGGGGTPLTIGFQVDATTGVWEKKIENLIPGQDYNVYCEADVKLMNKGSPIPRATDPKVATAKP